MIDVSNLDSSYQRQKNLFQKCIATIAEVDKQIATLKEMIHTERGSTAPRRLHIARCRKEIDKVNALREQAISNRDQLLDELKSTKGLIDVSEFLNQTSQNAVIVDGRPILPIPKPGDRDRLIHNSRNPTTRFEVSELNTAGLQQATPISPSTSSQPAT